MPLPQRIIDITNELRNLGIKQDEMYEAMFLRGVWWEPETYYPHFDCKDISVLKLKEHFAVKSLECHTGPVYPVTTVAIISEGDFLIEFYDESSDYQKDELFSQVLSTFRFLRQ